MKTLLLALALVTTAAQAAEPTHALCRVKETKGHQTEEYDLRMTLPEFDSQFNLRLFPKVLVEASVGSYDQNKIRQFEIGLYDYALEGEIMGDLEVGHAVGYNYLSLHVTFQGKPAYSADFSCSPETEE